MNEQYQLFHNLLVVCHLIKCNSFGSFQGVLQNCPAEVVLWTNHRVMEWLRNIDLSEYAPNLRGSGVHGALMVSSCLQKPSSHRLIISFTHLFYQLSYDFFLKEDKGS